MPVKGNYSKEHTMTTLFSIIALLALLTAVGVLKGISSGEELVILAIAGLFTGLIIAAAAAAAVVTFPNAIVLALAVLATAAGALAPIYGWEETTLDDYFPAPRGGHMNSGW